MFLLLHDLVAMEHMLSEVFFPFESIKLVLKSHKLKYFRKALSVTNSL